MKVGILTGGGDVPGLNPAIKAATLRMIGAGHTMMGIRKGWGGLLNFNPDDPACMDKYTLPLDPVVVRKIDRTGGTFLHSSRTNPSNVKAKDTPEFLKKTALFGDGSKEKYDYTPHVLSVLKSMKLDALIAIGGDDTLSYALRLHQEGFPVVAIPKTMDNDVRGTDYCIGFSTAMTRSVEFINNMRTAVGSHERIAIIELFGRNSGETSLVASYLAQTDRCVISEVPFNGERLAKMLRDDKKSNPSNYAMVTISEGATPEGGELIESGEADAYGHRKLGGVGEYLAEEVKKHTGEGIMYQNLAYLMRSGEPDALDKMVGLNYGTLAADLLLRNTTGHMVGLQKGAYVSVPLEELGGGARPLDVEALYDREQYRPKVRDVLNKPMFLY